MGNAKADFETCRTDDLYASRQLPSELSLETDKQFVVVNVVEVQPVLVVHRGG